MNPVGTFERPATGMQAQLLSSQRIEDFRSVRRTTERLAEPLETEDYVVQSMPDVSPTKWHLAHTTWFFENFLLAAVEPNHEPYHPSFGFLFNSYYETVGSMHARPTRGLLSRPTVREVFDYRSDVDERVEACLESSGNGTASEVLELGVHHEQQHQELLLMDIKHVLASNPLRPAYKRRSRAAPGLLKASEWLPQDAGIVELGHHAQGFAFDNERPRHQTLLPPYCLASRLVSNGEFLAFIEDGGYRRPELWLADGWEHACRAGWAAPLYWDRDDSGRRQHTLHGSGEIDPAEPVCHVSFYEADAFARWSGARLPTEAEWENAAASIPVEGNFLETGLLHPAPASGPATELQQMFGDLWEWTASPYTPYPGYQPLDGSLGEYNGKFMCNQMVLRGGCCVSPVSHLRASYRNFYQPEKRWPFTGIRLARNV